MTYHCCHLLPPFIIDSFIAVIGRQTMTPMIEGREYSYGAMDPAYGESHSAQAAAVEGVQQFLALGWCESQPAVAAGADDRGVGGGGVR
jgi:hypothetical protein